MHTQKMRLFGRQVIYTDLPEINSENIVSVLRTAISIHEQNRTEIDYLYRYYKGDQPILGRIKEVRPEINNKVVENRANEIVSFKVGYLMGEPVQYVSLTEDAETTQQILTLNGYMRSECKRSSDKALTEWFTICGTAYRMAVPDTAAEEDEAPFEMFVLDPRDVFVVRSSGLGNRVLMAVKIAKDALGEVIYSCWTRNQYFEISNEKILNIRSHYLGIPIVEYPANNARLGAFEIVLPLLDAINTTESNRIDGVEQFIQALLLFHNVDISSEDFNSLKSLGAIKFKDIDPQLKAEIDYITSEMNQAQMQVLVDHMYNTVREIVGMPSTSAGNTSDSSNNGAVILKNGWQSAEARAKDSEEVFEQPERDFLKIVLRICKDLRGLSLKNSDLEIRFTRRNYENITEKANVLVMLLGCEKVHPQLAFQSCGLFSDSQLAYRMSMEYMREQEIKKNAEIDREGNGADSGNPAPAQSGGDQSGEQ